MSVIKRECTHAIPLSLISRSSLNVCRLSSQLWSGWHWRVSGAHSLSTWELDVAFYPPSTLSPLPTSSLPPDLHTYITPNWTSRGSWKMPKRRGTIIHVAQPLMQICLLMNAFWARRICLMPILYMSATWPQCPIALSMRSGVRFLDLLSGLFLWCGQKTMNWVGRVSAYINVFSDLLCLNVLWAVYQDKWKPWHVCMLTEKYSRTANRRLFLLLMIYVIEFYWSFFWFIKTQYQNCITFILY